MRPIFAPTVGVSPGTTTLQLGSHTVSVPYATFEELRDTYAGSGITAEGVAPLIPKSRIRWDIIGVVGGASLVVAIGAGLIASLLSD
jgi:hypothetical protein